MRNFTGFEDSEQTFDLRPNFYGEKQAIFEALKSLEPERSSIPERTFGPKPLKPSVLKILSKDEIFKVFFNESDYYHLYSYDKHDGDEKISEIMDEEIAIYDKEYSKALEATDYWINKLQDLGILIFFDPNVAKSKIN